MAHLRSLIAVYVAAIAAMTCQHGAAATLPGDAPQLIGTLKAEIGRYWPEVTPRAWVPALIEQESLWRVRAQLKTDRELGCGLGQFTKAFNADGSVRFDALTETKRLDPSLANWSWQDCANAQMQMRAVVLKLRSHERQCVPLMATNRDAKACNAAVYNGGGGSITKRIRSCQVTAGCDPRVWFGHLDTQCPQSRVRHAGYAESFCEINSKYPARIEERMPKYQEVMR
jgi:hypothetical protein